MSSKGNWLRNIRFKKEGISLDHKSILLLHADLVAITCEFQKNNRRNKTVHIVLMIIYYAQSNHGLLQLGDYGIQYRKQMKILEYALLMQTKVSLGK